MFSFDATVVTQTSHKTIPMIRTCSLAAGIREPAVAVAAIGMSALPKIECTGALQRRLALIPA